MNSKKEKDVIGQRIVYVGAIFCLVGVLIDSFLGYLQLAIILTVIGALLFAIGMVIM